MAELKKTIPGALFYLVLMLSIAGPASADLGNGDYYRLETDKSFADVMEDLAFAIGSNNFRQTSRNAIGAAIRQRQGSAFEEATVVHFCNLEYARKLLQVSADYLIHMPCRIAIWQTAETVFLEVKLVPNLLRGGEGELVERINRTLIQIVDQSVERWQRTKD